MSKCLSTGCTKEGKSRSLCANCYQSAVRAVERGDVTWDALERAGLVSKATRERGKNLFTKMMLENKDRLVRGQKTPDAPTEAIYDAPIYIPPIAIDTPKIEDILVIAPDDALQHGIAHQADSGLKTTVPPWAR